MTPEEKRKLEDFVNELTREEREYLVKYVEKKLELPWWDERRLDV